VPTPDDPKYADLVITVIQRIMPHLEAMAKRAKTPIDDVIIRLLKALLLQDDRP
jgi:hypothetical protein